MASNYEKPPHFRARTRMGRLILSQDGTSTPRQKACRKEIRSERIEYFSDPLFSPGVQERANACTPLFRQEYKSVRTHVLPTRQTHPPRSRRAPRRTDRHRRRSNNDETIDRPPPLWHTACPRRAQHNKKERCGDRTRQPIFI